LTIKFTQHTGHPSSSKRGLPRPASEFFQYTDSISWASFPLYRGKDLKIANLKVSQVLCSQAFTSEH